MIRIVLLNIILFLLPTILYLTGTMILRRKLSILNAKMLFNRGPLVWLNLAGLVCVICSLAYFSTYTGGKPGEVYHPPIYKE